jgi:hypothetical protein
MGRLLLLGPQRLHPDLVEAVDAEGAPEPFAAVTAGWEEREDEIDELREHLGRRVRNLRLWSRSEDAFAEDPALFEAYRERRARLRELQEAYRRRLAHLCEALRELEDRSGRPDVLDPEREDALEQVRALDARHLLRVEEIHAAFVEGMRPLERPSVATRRDEVLRVLDECPSVAIAGGHVGVLGSRLRLFALESHLRGRTVFAWSAGAMVACDRIVLFHDFPPQGPGYPEVLARGLSLARGLLPLPHASRRLALDDRRRVGFLARRFAPDPPVTLDPGSALRWDGRRWKALRPRSRRLETDGRLSEVALA